MVTDRNYWATYRDDIAAWCGEIPPPGKLGMERVFEFARHILETAEREQVMRVLGVPALAPAKNGDELSWFEFSHAWFEREGNLDLFPGHGSMPKRFGGKPLRLPARLAYYKGERIVEEEIEDVGDLEKSVVTARGGDPYGIRHTLPMVLSGGSHNEPDQPLSPAVLLPVRSLSPSACTRTSGSRASPAPTWAMTLAVTSRFGTPLAAVTA